MNIIPGISWLFIGYCFFFGGIISAQDTIPITIGNDNRIYLKASVNGVEDLNFIFDTGASGMVLNTTMTDGKLDVNFDSSTDNIGANGVSTQQVSTGNKLEIGDFKRENVSMIGIDYPEAYYSFDGVIGYPFFEDFLMEINYERQIIVIHKTKKSIEGRNSYKKVTLDFSGDLFYMDMKVDKGGKPVTFPVMLDTGYNGGLIIYHKIVSKKGLADHFEVMGKSKSEGTDGTVISSENVIIPEAELAKLPIKNINANLNLTPASTDFTAILGGEVMKDFIWIFDYTKRELYLKSN